MAATTPQSASFFDVVAAIGSDFKAMFTGEPLALSPLQGQIDALTVQLRAANKAGDKAGAQKLLQQIRDLQAKQAQMPDPLVGRLAVVNNVDNAVAGVKDATGGFLDFVGGVGNKILFAGVGGLLLYAYLKNK